MNSNMTLCVGILFHEISDIECLISRITASVIIFVSIFAILFNIRFLYWSSYHRNIRSRHYSLIISMIISSMSVIIVIGPSVFIQCFSCYRWCSQFYCRLEGFISYLNGCVNMFMLMMISLIRYATVIQSNRGNKYFEKHPFLAVCLCWLGGLIFAIPPLFNWNAYVPEGIGFHCGLNWFDRSIYSRFYFILAFTFVYFIPLTILFVVNIYVYCVIRRLIYDVTTKRRSNMFLKVSDRKHQSTSCTSSCGSSSITTHVSAKGLNRNSHSVLPQTSCILPLREVQRLHRLKVDQRFALATTFLVSEYLLSWTPYAFVALFYLFNAKFLNEQSILMTICAFIAKISMILNPFIYIATIKSEQLKAMLYCKQCSCSYCRMKRTIIIF